MSDNTYQSDQFKAPRRVRVEVEAKAGVRGWFALLLSLLAFIPLLPLLGAGLGVSQLKRLADSGASGRGVAGAAVVLGLLMTVTQAGAVFLGARSVSRTQSQLSDALHAGQRGDIVAFLNAFASGEADADNTRAATGYHRMLTHRYGAFEAADCEVPLAGVPLLDGGAADVTYTLRFTDATLTANVVQSPTRWSDLWSARPRLRSIVITDPEVGVIPYPPPAQAQAKSKDPAQDQDDQIQARQTDPANGADYLAGVETGD